MEWQTTAYQPRGSFSKKPYAKNQNVSKKDQMSFSKTQNFTRSSKNLSSKGVQHSYQQKSPKDSNKNQRKYGSNSNNNSSAYAAEKALKPENTEPQDEATKFLEMCKYFTSKQAIYSLANKVESFVTKAIDGQSSNSELNGFKIVQNGTVLHDETSEEKAKPKHSLISSFSFENRFKPHSESALSFLPGSRLIPLPTFIEAQE